MVLEDASEVLNFQHRSAEFGGSGLAGAAWFDFNNDDWPDLFLANGKTQPNALFRNNGDGTFTDVAVSAGVANGQGNSGVLAADIDNDGFEDLFLTGDGGVFGEGMQSPAKLYVNRGDGTFDDVTEASGIVPPETALMATFGDIDNDGFLDLFITASGSVRTREQHASKLFHNNGDRTFTDITAEAGLTSERGACAAQFLDFDTDGRLDLLVGNCNDIFLRPTPIELFHNNADGTFTDVAEQVGLSSSGYWMGFGLADYDNDGDVDLFVTNTGASLPIPFWHALYDNSNGGTFSDVGTQAGITSPEFGWGVVCPDLDNDGYADIFFAGSEPHFGVIGSGRGNPGVLLLNDHQGGFYDASGTMPVDLAEHYSSGVAHCDYDRDGFADIVVVIDEHDGDGGRPVLLHNVGNDNHWLTLRLRGTESNRSAVGARITVTTIQGTQVREIYAGSSFLCTDSKWPTFGLGPNESVEQITIRWPLGRVEQFGSAQADQLLTLVEGQGQMVLEPLGGLGLPTRRLRAGL
jgi:hypothetical protein